MQILGFQKTTLLDYPKHLAATVFLGGCNFRCPFCHNAGLVLPSPDAPVIPEEEVLSVLAKRRNILEGVCLTGGEPTIFKELPAFIERIKALGLSVKLDTNGTNPDLLAFLIKENLVDYIAMDIKNSLQKYPETIGLPDGDPRTDGFLSSVQKSVRLLMSCGLPYEFRTTAVRELHEAGDFESIGRWLTGAEAYFIQSFEDSGDIIGEGLSSWNREALSSFLGRIRLYIPSASLRGIDEKEPG